MTTATTLRVGLVGCGNVALRAHLPAFLATPGAEVRAVADPTPDRLAAAREAAGLAASDAHPDWRDLVARPDVDAVVVATPQRFRPEIALAAAAAGKHLLCEKPLALAPTDAHAIVAAARRHNVTLATVHNYVFMPVYRAIKGILESGEIGTPELITLNFLSVEDRPGAAAYRPRWRHAAAESGGGVLMDMLHAVYLAGWLMGADPIAVAAAVDRRLSDEGDVEDLALVRYRFPRGHAQVNIAWGHGPSGVAIAGTQGRLLMVTRGFGTHPFVLPERLHVVGPTGAREVVPDAAPDNGIAGVAADFRDAISQGRSPSADGEAGARVLEAVVAAYAAAALGRELPLPLAPDDPVHRRGAAGIGDLPLPADSPVRRLGLYGTAAAPPPPDVT